MPVPIHSHSNVSVHYLPMFTYVYYVCRLASGIRETFLHFGSQVFEAIHKTIHSLAALFAGRDPFVQSLQGLFRQPSA